MLTHWYSVNAIQISWRRYSLGLTIDTIKLSTNYCNKHFFLSIVVEQPVTQ